MDQPMMVTDATLDTVLSGGKPVLLLFSNGDGLRGDFRVAYRKQAAETAAYVFAQIDPTTNPAAVERFSIGSKPTLVGLVNGTEIVRRTRPWGSDLPLVLDMMQQAVAEAAPVSAPDAAAASQNPTQPQEETQMTDVNNTPVAVTDATFEDEVLAADVPVLVDFWAEWCGPCRMVAPILDKLAGEFAGQIKIAKVNVDENPGLSQAFRIQSIPTLMVVKERTIIFNQPGALPEPVMRDLVQQAIAVEIPPREEEAEGEPSENAGD